MTGSSDDKRRVVITGLGLISPLGNTPAALWSALAAGKSGVSTTSIMPADRQPLKYAAEAREFTGEVEDFGPLEKERKKAIKKGLKVMCRETRMAVAAAQLAIADAGFAEKPMDPESTGVVLGSDYMLTMPEDYSMGMKTCAPAGEFEYSKWGKEGLGDMAPLWLLKYLPNLPASHIAIFNDLRGPNNSLTMREASSNLAISEAYCTIVRGHADAMLAGATGSKIHPVRTVHAVTQEEIAIRDGDPAKLSRPFDKHRCGAVIGEGAACLMLEELEHAQTRGAKILGEVIGHGASAVADARGVGQYKTAFVNVLTQ